MRSILPKVGHLPLMNRSARQFTPYSLSRIPRAAFVEMFHLCESRSSRRSGQTVGCSASSYRAVHPPLSDLPDRGGAPLGEELIVTHQQERAWIGDEGLLQSLDTAKIQVIGGFIQN